MRTLPLFAAGFALLAAAAAPAAPTPDRPAPKPMTRAEVQQKVAERFAKWDTNRDGKVTQAEFDAARQAMRAERGEKRFARLDADGNGSVTKAEFAAAHDGKGAARPEGKRDGGRRFAHRGGPGMGRGGLMAMDANKDGAVTLAEAAARPLAMFDRADTNKDGVVTPEERRAAWSAMRGPKPTA
ncbi:MAG: EF-hand domain-containing protein [Sphingomonas fennica]